MLKTKYNVGKTELEKKILIWNILLKKQNSMNWKIKFLIISNLATKTALTTVENKIPHVSNLVNKTDHNTKVTEIENKHNNHNHDKYIDTSEFNKLKT